MILSDSMQNLESLSNSDKKTLLTYTEEAELRRIALIKFRKTIETIVNCGIKCKTVEFGSAVCTQSKIYDENYSLSGMMLKFPKYNPGTLRFDHIKDFFGSVESDENTTVLPTVHFPCLQTIDFMSKRTFTQEFTFKVESGISKLMTADGTLVCVSHERYASDTRNYHGKVIVYDLDGKLKFNSRQYAPCRDKREIIVVYNGKFFAWFGSSIRTLQVEHDGKATSTKFLVWKNDIPNLSGYGFACIIDNGNLLFYMNNKFYEVYESGKIVRSFSSKCILERHSQNKPNCILYTKTKAILIAFDVEILATSLSGELLHSHKSEDNYCNFVSMCEDRHGNVFVADSYGGRICLMGSDGIFIRDVLTFDCLGPQFHHYRSMSVTIDGKGNLWVLEDRNITVYSYL
ncbi:unnamed protein product [Mytilus edulis]|uniref:Tripartite motif-containing protein 2 n=1 Tax=Mytilus edulis TaxID=6550 RepID=A0A8S3UY64_MYTED|nr:unnamed protein product [Mytilus edulis]